MIWKNIGRWALLAIAIPLAGIGLRRLGDAMEAKRGGPTKATSVIRKSADGLDFVAGRSSRR